MKVDLTLLKDVTGDDQEILLEMLTLFSQDIPSQIDNIQAFADEEELQKMGAEAHKLKSTLQYVGFFEMFEIIKELERLGKKGEPDPQISSLLNDLSEMREEAEVLLQDKLKEMS